MDTSTGHPKRWAILAVMCLALILTGLDTFIITVALPSIRNEIGATAGQLQWTIDAYSLAFAAPILFSGSLADRFGRRNCFLLGMLIFLAGSAAAATADGATILVAARVAMGLGAAFIMPSTLSLIRHVFPSEERGKAMGIWVGVAGLGIPLGPLVGGALLQNFWWGSVFLINVPIVLVAIIGCLVLIPESRNVHHPGLDYVGLLLSIVGSLSLVYGIIELPDLGWAAVGSGGLIVVGIAILVGFVTWERRTAQPMLSHAVFRDRRFGGPLVTISTIFFGVFGGLFLITQYLQTSLGFGPLAAGLHMLAICAAMIAAPVSAKLVERFGLGPVTMFGPLLVAASMATLAIGEPPSGGRVIIALGLLGLGIGFGAPPSMDSILAATPAEQSGAGSAVADVASQFGGALGIAIMGSVALSASGGMQTASLIGLGVGVAGATVAGAILPRARVAAPVSVSA